MTEESQVVEAETDAEVVVEAPARDYEKEAREAGWVPEAEFKGDKKPAKFLDAEEFVRRGEEIAPLIRKENSRLKAELEKEKSEFQKRIERLEKSNAKAFEAAQRQHEAEVARVRREQRAAVAAGDEAEFDRLEKERTDLEKAAPKADEPEKIDPAATLAQKQDAWRAANPWFDDDFEMQEFAIKYSDFHGRKHPNMSFEDNMKVVEAEVKKKFPEKFGGSARPAANGHAAVDAGGDFSGVFKGKGKSEADLPAEAKSAGARYVAQGLYKDMKSYAKAYFEEN